MTNRIYQLLSVTVLLVTGFFNVSLYANEAQGTLIVDVKSFTSEIKLKNNILRKLESGGLPWGVENGQLVMSLVNRRFITFDISQMTRYGNKKTMKLKPGTYTLTCAGFKYKGGFSTKSVLRKAAFFNVNSLSFNISAGKTTTLEVSPIIQKSKTLLIKVYMPDLKVKVIENGVTKVEKFISKRSTTSIAWNDYNGPLKFKSKIKESKEEDSEEDDF